jgi:alanyl-tRNA synthetase
MTRRLYYTDAESLEFDAVVTQVRSDGGQPMAVLDQTAFYPTSGGQPCDTGRLGGARVLDVVDEGEQIVHVLSKPLEPGAIVRGVIDADRRRDHMQQHTGQHILSASFDRLFGSPTVSFHLGSEACTIDLATPVSPLQVEQAVDEANRVVWDNRPVVVRFTGADEARSAGLRKDTVRQGELRLIDVKDFDLSACGGTHVPATGVIGLIAVIGTEKFKGGLRVSFVCGRRALAQLRLLRDAVAESSRVLSVAPVELPEAIRRLQTESKTLRRRAADLDEALATQEAGRLMAEASANGAAAVVAVMEGWVATGLRAIASRVIASGPAQVVLTTSEEPVAVVVAQSVPGGVPATDVIAMLTARFGGRGGGSAGLAQAGGLAASPRAVVEAAGAAMGQATGSLKPGTRSL